MTTPFYLHPDNASASHLPAGHVEVIDGEVRTLDLVWDMATKRWAHPTPTDFKMRGRDVARYFRVARRQH